MTCKTFDNNKPLESQNIQLGNTVVTLFKAVRHTYDLHQSDNDIYLFTSVIKTCM